jgi:NAD(P)-dependent dehydrogenase (short-subunit alcohol dehydrogenase family)
MFRLDGKVALVTGGYGGIGVAVCRSLAGMGVKVAVAGHDAHKGATQGGRRRDLRHRL